MKNSPTEDSTSNSSHNSLARHCSGDSPISTFPPGNSQSPAKCRFDARRAASTFPLETINAAVTNNKLGYTYLRTTVIILRIIFLFPSAVFETALGEENLLGSNPAARAVIKMVKDASCRRMRGLQKALDVVKQISPFAKPGTGIFW